MNGRIVILSDTHLGRPTGAAMSAEALRPLWRDASHLIMNGDVGEIHHPEYRAEAARQVLRLQSLVEEDGVTLTVLSGNHDPYISDLRHLTLRRGEIFVTHGDVLHPAVAPWSPAAQRMRESHADAMAALDPHERSELGGHLWASQQASVAEWNELDLDCEKTSIWSILQRPWAVMQVMRYWRIIPDLAAAFAAEHVPASRYVIIGHTHHPGIWRRRGRVVINTGCYGFPGRPRAVVVEDDRMTVWGVNRNGVAYAFSPEPIRSFELRPDPPVSDSGTGSRTPAPDRSSTHVQAPRP